MAKHAPRYLGDAGRDLWRSVTSAYELEPHESALLIEAARTSDLIASLAEDAAAGSRAVLPELRQQRLCLARLLSALKVDGPKPSTGGRQRRRNASYGPS